MSRYTKLGYETGKLVAQKNAAYGSSFAKAGDFLRILFPDGVPPERFDDALLLVRIFDKLMRIATDRDAFGESPYRDIAGYGLLGAVMHEERDSTPCGTANADADSRPKETPASDLRPANPATTTNERSESERSSESRCLPRRESSSLAVELQDAFARSATDRAQSVEDDLRKGLTRSSLTSYDYPSVWFERQDAGRCAICSDPFNGRPLQTWNVNGERFSIHAVCEPAFHPLVRRLGLGTVGEPVKC